MGVNAGGLLNLMNSDDDRMLVQRKLRAAQRLVTEVQASLRTDSDIMGVPIGFGSYRTALDGKCHLWSRRSSAGPRTTCSSTRIRSGLCASRSVDRTRPR